MERQEEIQQYMDECIGALLNELALAHKDIVDRTRHGLRVRGEKMELLLQQGDEVVTWRYVNPHRENGRTYDDEGALPWPDATCEEARRVTEEWLRRYAGVEDTQHGAADVENGPPGETEEPGKESKDGLVL